MSQFFNYEEMAQRHNAAYAAFCSIYEAKTPPPAKPNIARDIVSLVIVLALLVVMVASIVVSSSRTIVEFGGDAIGAMAFVMLEGGLVAYAFFRARRNASASKIEDARKLATFGLILAFISAIGANIDNVLKTHGLFIPSEVNMVINLLVAISAPTLAFISSDVLALELMAGEVKRRQVMATYDEKYQEWLDGLNASWNSQKSKWGVEVRITNEPNSLPVSVQPVQLSSGQVGHGQGYSRESKATSIVRAHLDAYPEDMSIPVRELAEKLGVGKSTVANVIKEMKS